MQALALKTVQFPAVSLNKIAHWASRAQSRAALAKLDDAALLDIGVSYQEAHEEANKPFWQ